MTQAIGRKEFSGAPAGKDQTRTARGGKAVYGAALGILMLEARFPRIPGDMGNALTWPFPVLYKVVRGASPKRVVTYKAQGLKDAFIAAAKELVSDGADGITTNCGFLSLFQNDIAAAAGVPVAASSLMQVPFIERLLPRGRRAGILTVSRAALTKEHLLAAGAPADAPVMGAEGGEEFTRVLLNDEPSLDAAAAERDLLAAGEALVKRHPEVGAVVLECTNMIPYARALGDRLKLPVFDMYGFCCWFHSGLKPRDFGPPGSAG
jgi:Asp/Glu/hydantoin racemase